jgi:hypothetical protein
MAAADLPGAQLLGGPRPHTLSSLYTRLAGLFFDTLWHEPDEAALRGLTHRTRPQGLILVTDCDLPGDATARLTESFPECVFLFTSTAPTLADAECVHEVRPLDAAQTARLVSEVLGRDLREAELAQVGRAHELAQGRVAALVTYAAFLKRAADDPRQTDLVALPPAQQAALLVAGLDEPLRRVLAALGAFGAVPAELFPVLSGSDTTGTPEALAALERAGLVVPADDGYAATGDAAAAAAGLIDAQYVHALAIRVYAPTVVARVPAHLALEVVRALISAQDWDLASQLARASSAAAAEGGRVPAWSELNTLGAQAARNADRRDDLAYFLRQQHTDALLRRDAAAAAALLLLLGELLRAPVAPTAPSPSHTPRPRTSRRMVHGARRLASAGHGAGGFVAAVLVAAIVGAVLGLVRPSGGQAVSGTAASVSGQAANALKQAPAWTVTVAAPTSAPGTQGTGTVEFPEATVGVASNERAHVDTLLQQPLRARIAFGTEYLQQQTAAGISNSGQTESEHTIVSQTGDLVSIVYDYGFDDGASDNAGSTAVVMRKDTAAVIPQNALLTTQAATSAGAARLNALVAALMPKSGSSAPVDGADPVAVGCQQIDGSTFVGPAITVTSTGLTFYVSNQPGGCAGIVPVQVPFNELRGLVNPLVQQLATVPVGGAK